MTWHILGAGSLGTLWATRLARAGFPVTLLLRNAQRLAGCQAVGGPTGGEAGHSRHIAWPAQSLEACAPIRGLLLACKAYDALSASQAVAPRLAAGAERIPLQNGLGSQDA